MRTIGIFLFIFYTSFSHAGLKSLTHHSRANCVGFNETISWWAGHAFVGRVISKHYPLGKPFPDSKEHHTIDTGTSRTWRHAAYHAKEARSGDAWRVRGIHYLYQYGDEIVVQVDNVADCSIYDGWWD